MMGKDEDVRRARVSMTKQFLHPHRLFRMLTGDFRHSPKSVLLCVGKLVVTVRTHLRHL
jgi:hypothetical protein